MRLIMARPSGVKGVGGVGLQAEDDDQSGSDEEDEMKPPPFPEVSLELCAEAGSWSIVGDFLNVALRSSFFFFHC